MDTRISKQAFIHAVIKLSNFWFHSHRKFISLPLDITGYKLCTCTYAQLYIPYQCRKVTKEYSQLY